MPRWENWPLEDLLDLRLCDLRLRLAGTWLEPLTDRVQEELRARGLALKPHFWLADEWFTPEGVTGAAIPFYLAHPRLMQLERKQMLEVEGGTRSDCLMLLRHELGHVVDFSFRLNRRRRYRELFGRASDAYPTHYRPNPRSKRFVQHLDGWYAQAHPLEDFAETFACWLAPRSRWRTQYAKWPALKKLEYVDQLMAELAGKPPKWASRERPSSLPRLRRTLRTHYRRKRAHYASGFTDVYDRDLLKIFSDDPAHRKRRSAADFLRRNRRSIRELVARWTHEYQFTLDQNLKEMTGRCRELKLRLRVSERQAKTDFAIMLAVHTMQNLYTGEGWHAV
ncbi:MAG: putative zinc-binding metallopeptidase [Deltaproteobacteria bacterium]|jgi:hypothetical protein|nr:putative zinc-binding metallopeptidase [Deltaproteobacteria bacterium]MBW2537889.1 putative zinc-binding metallopeptidase [Deltaproteobacteria bacterium]